MKRATRLLQLLAILLFNEREKDLRIRYAVGHREEIVRNVSIALGEGITGNVVADCAFSGSAFSSFGRLKYPTMPIPTSSAALP